MNSNQLAAYKILEKAQLALKSGDKNTAQEHANQAAQLAPELEEVWLLMAALASPSDSISFLEKALQINPNSQRAKKGLVWAKGRLQTLQQDIVVDEGSKPLVEPETQDGQAQPSVSSEPVGADFKPALGFKPAPQDIASLHPLRLSASKPALTWVLITSLLILIAIGLSWAAWQGIIPVSEIINSNPFVAREHGPSSASVIIQKSTVPLLELTPTEPSFDEIILTTEPAPTTDSISSGVATVTPQFFPSQTSEPTAIPFEPTTAPTQTAIVPIETPVATTEFIATLTPVDIFPTVTNTPIPTEISYPLATITSEPGLAELQSPTPLPTDTSEPAPAQTLVPTLVPYSGTGGGTHWVDVNLTQQMAYAYAGDTIVNSFLVSTGTWQHPTVTGQFHVYVKYQYTDMSGDGYYLPNVPYTMYFFDGYALHGTYWHNNFGTPMSHGCVNFSIPDAEWVYNFSSVGTLVNVHY